jgi:hypothetical protein
MTDDNRVRIQKTLQESLMNDVQFKGQTLTEIVNYIVRMYITGKQARRNKK